MQLLNNKLRKQLEGTVIKAREVAETAALAALDQLGVGYQKPDPYLTDAEKKLRNRLRIHGKQLGDERDSRSTNPTYGKQETDRLVEEMAYQHWHRMLFARFLAENNLLMYWSNNDEEPIDIPLEACQELIDEGTEEARSMWELAARCATRMLPQIFRIDSPVFELDLPPEYQLKLERLVALLPQEVFTASDSLGWVYQFWQTKKKKDVNESLEKVGARELPAVTQLFTEPYMVHFLLDNSLGAWWAARWLSDADLKTAISEDELRKKASLPGVPLNYLRFVKLDDCTWTPATGTHSTWPEQLSELKTLDPCCGSGHFLVAAFLMLVPMRMEYEGISAQEAVDAVLSQNIHGLEIDKRCVELAAFALAITAWKYPGTGGYRLLPELNLACTGLTINTQKDEWLSLGGNDNRLSLALEKMYEQFEDASILGSLINPEIVLEKDSLFALSWNDIGPLISKALASEQDDENTEIGIVANGIVKAATLLSDKYWLVFTNPPYLVRGKQTEKLQNFLTLYYNIGDADIATVFLKRFDDFLLPDGVHCSVTPLNWYYLKSYEKLRRDLINHSTLLNLTKVGSGATAKVSWDVLRAVAIIAKGKQANEHIVTGLEATTPSEDERSLELRKNKLFTTTSSQLKDQPDAKFAFGLSDENELLESYVRSYQGPSTADYSLYGRKYWEVQEFGLDWVLQASTFKEAIHYGGLESILLWEKGCGSLSKNPKAAIRGEGAHGKKGVIVTQTRKLPATIYLGGFFDNNVAALVTETPDIASAIWCYCSSNKYYSDVRKLDEKLGVTNATLAKVPFDIDYWTKVAIEKYPYGLPKPYSNDPTQWIFHGHPCGSVVWNEKVKWTENGILRINDTTLQIAVSRLLGYRWPTELDTDIELADEQRKWVKHSKELHSYMDDDGIVCIPPVRGEACAADHLLNLLAAAYGDCWTSETLAKLLKSVDHAGKTLETWLRDKFFIQHCKLFKHRPFIWHIWDGLRDGFSALVNYHKLDFKLLETLIYTYLGDWIRRQKDDIESGIDGARERLAAAVILKQRLKLILEGEAPYDIFVRWKSLHLQPIGWCPDLNDGVRINIRPFLSVPDVRKKGAGVLRAKPNIKWNKDRGKEPERSIEEFPWFWGWDGTVDFTGGAKFTGERFNDCHYTIAMKKRVRES